MLTNVAIYSMFLYKSVFFTPLRVCYVKTCAVHLALAFDTKNACATAGQVNNTLTTFASWRPFVHKCLWAHYLSRFRQLGCRQCPSLEPVLEPALAFHELQPLVALMLRLDAQITTQSTFVFPPLVVEADF